METKTFLKALTFMHLSLVIGLVIFTLIAVSQGKGFNTSTDGSDVFLYIVPVAALLGYFGSQFVFNKMISKVKDSESFEVKLKKFQSASHVKYALIEFPALLSLFAYYNSGNALPLVIAVCLLVYLFVQKPNKERILATLPLNSDEQRRLNSL